MPEVVARIGVDLDPIDVTDADDARWLRACLPPDQPERIARLDAEIALAATARPQLLTRRPRRVAARRHRPRPRGALPVVTSTWALSKFSLESRQRFLGRLKEAAVGRTIAWVSAEGVGVAPTIRPSATAPPLATASSAWRGSARRLNPPRPSAAAGCGAKSWPG